MKTTKRFEKAVTKLYTAYHNNELNAFNCEACAVGNIVGHSNWTGIDVGDDNDGNVILKGNTYKYPSNNPDYTPEELRKIEETFLIPWVGKPYYRNDGYTSMAFDKPTQYLGLIAVVELLAEFDDIPNPFNLENLFSEDKEVAKQELELINHE